MKVLMMFFLLCFISPVLDAQEKELRRWAIDLQFICTGQIQGWQAGHITDDLIASGQMGYGLDYNVSYYISRQWGIYSGINLGWTKKGRFGQDVIPDRIKDLYAGEYYIQGAIRDRYDGVFSMFYAGVQYRMYYKKWLVIPRMSCGMEEIGAESCCFRLKGKGNNDLYKVAYFLEGKKPNFPSRMFLNPNVLIGYYLKDFYLTFEAGYIQYLSKINYIERKSDIYTDGISEERILKQQHLPAKYDFRIGVTIPFGKMFGLP